MGNQTVTITYSTGSPTGASDLTEKKGSGASNITFNLSTNVSGAKFAGIRLQSGTTCPSSTTVYGQGTESDSVGPFTKIKQNSSGTKLSMKDSNASSTTWSYSIGVTDGSASYWDDPKIYNKGP